MKTKDEEIIEAFGKHIKENVREPDDPEVTDAIRGMEKQIIKWRQQGHSWENIFDHIGSEMAKLDKE